MHPSCWYYIIAAVLTAYQGYRGFMFQWKFNEKMFNGKVIHRVTLLCIADAILYIVCSIAGFISLWFAYKCSINVPPNLDISTGRAILLSSLWLFSLLGISGQLPNLIQQGKLLPRA